MSKERIKELLTKIGQKVGINLVYLVKNGSWVTLRFFVLAVGGWLVSLCFARLGSKELLGQYQFIIAFLSIVGVFSLPGLNAAVLEAMVKGQEGSVIRTVKISLLCSLMAIPFILGFGLFNLLRGETGVGEAFLLAALFFPFYYSLNTWQSYYEGKSLFKDSSWRLMLLHVVLSLALIAGLFLNVGLQSLVLIFFGINTFFFALYFREVFLKIQDRNRQEMDVGFGVKVSLQKFVFGLSSTLPPLLISFLFGSESVAVYYIASYLITAIFAFLGTLSALYLPILFRGLRLNHGNILWQNAVVGVASWVLFIFFLKFLFILVYGQGYAESLAIAYNISFLLLLIPFKTYLLSFFMTRKKNWFLIRTVSIANLVAFAFFYYTREWNFAASVTTYLYVLEFLTTLPLLFVYYRDSFIRNEH